jgi:3-phenylpropionate/trans-cinnamate dioxygenase ferredoxin subunit
MKFNFVCDADSIQVGAMAKFNIEGKPVVIYHLEDGFYATQRRCTHMCASLDKGKIINKCRIQCWLHHAVFNIKTGKVIKWANFPPGIQVINVLRKEKNLEVYETKVEDNQVYVGI